MKKIKLSNYNTNMGILIDVRRKSDYINDPTKNSINIYADELLLNYKTYLSYDKKYYIYCKKGYLSRRVVNMLEYLKYDVTQVIE